MGLLYLLFHCVVYLKMFKTVVVEFKDNCFSLICCIVSHICRFKSSLSVFCRPRNTVDHFTPKLHFISKFSVDFMVCLCSRTEYETKPNCYSFSSCFVQDVH